MKATSVKVLSVQGERRTVKAIIVADSPPNPLPVNGKGSRDWSRLTYSPRCPCFSCLTEQP